MFFLTTHDFLVSFSVLIILPACLMIKTLLYDSTTPHSAKANSVNPRNEGREREKFQKVHVAFVPMERGHRIPLTTANSLTEHGKFALKENWTSCGSLPHVCVQ